MRRRVPTWAWLAGIVVASALVRYVLARRVVAPWIFVDELIYSELAKSLADSGELTVRDVDAGGAYGVVYPLLIAPAWRAFDAVPDAYAAAKAINAVVMSLAAVPAYFLARRVVSQGMALVAAAFAVAVPSMAYTGTLMTENAFYPLFLVVALGLVGYLETPSFGRACLLLLALLVAFATRAQALALVPAVLTAPLLLAGLRRRGLTAFRDLYWLVAGVLGVVLAVQLVRGRSPRDLLGAYEPVGDRGYELGRTLRWLGYHLAELDLYVAAVPLFALVLLVLRARALPPAGQVFVAATVSLAVWMLVAVAMFASEVPDPPRVMERNLFYVVPLLVIALLVWIDLGAPRRRKRALAAAAAVAALPLAVPFDRFLVPEAAADTLALLPWWRVHDAGVETELLAVLAALVAAAAVSLALLMPGPGLLALVGVAFAATTLFAQFGARGIETASRSALAAGIGEPDRDWIDRALGSDAGVVFVWTGHASRFALWENEVFNRSVRNVYAAEAPLPGDLPEEPFAAARAPFAVSDGTLVLDGHVVAEDERRGLTVYRVGGPLVRIGGLDGLYPGDTWSGPTLHYRWQGCRRGTLAMRVRTDAAVPGVQQTVRVQASGAVVAVLEPGEERLLFVGEIDAPDCQIVLTVDPVGRAPGDPRALGVHVLSVDFVRG
jgi:hypothetical protein